MSPDMQPSFFEACQAAEALSDSRIPNRDGDIGMIAAVTDQIQGLAAAYRRTIPVPVLHAAVSEIPVPAPARDEDGAVEVTPPVDQTNAIGPQPARTRRVTLAV